MSAAFYYAKPVRVSAFQFCVTDDPTPLWFQELVRKGAVAMRAVGGIVRMRIARGNLTAINAVPGDWIVQREDTIFVVKDTAFKRLYAPALEPVPQYDMAMG